MLGVTFILYQGIKETAYATTIMVLFKIFVMMLFIGIGIFYIVPENYTPFIPEYQPDTKRYGWWGIVTASHIAFFAYMGFNSVATAASEAKNPQKDIPFAILGTLLICTILYSLLAFVLTGVVNYSDLIGNNAPLALAADKIGISWFRILLKIGALVALSSVMLVSTYSMIRVMIFMANDGLFPKIFAHISVQKQIPIYNTLILGGVLAILAGLFPIDILGDIVTCGTLLAAAIICFAVFWLYLKQPNMPRPFRTPFTPFVSLLGVVICVFLAISAGFDTLLYLSIYIFVIGGLITIYRYFY
jgi:APA family basic amino acid/polyamine antiporter